MILCSLILFIRLWTAYRQNKHKCPKRNIFILSLIFNNMANVTKITEEYIKNHPYIIHSLRNGIINYSKLARKISDEKNIHQIDAILIACRRYFNKIKESDRTKPILQVLKQSKLSIKNKIIVVILKNDVSNKFLLDLQKHIFSKGEVLHIIRGANAITLITPDDFLKDIESKFKPSILKISKGLVEVILKSPNCLENLPGFTGYIYSLFGENNINILETMSCWTDTIFVIKEEDLSKTMVLFKF